MATDWIVCKRDTPIYRLGCQVNTEAVTVETEIEDTFSSHNSNSTGVRKLFDVGDALQLPVKALIPKLKVQINWTAQCWPDDPSVFNGNIFIHVNGLESNVSLRVGDNLYICEIPQWIVEDSTPGKFKLKTTFALKDNSSQPVVPPTKGLSPECKILVNNLRVEFDAVAIAQALMELKEKVEEQSKIMNLASIIHADLINDKNVAICQLIRLADKLRTIQNVTESSMLSLSAKRLIAGFVEQAVERNLLAKPTSQDSFDFFVENESELFTQVGGLTCSNLSSSSLLPSKEPFVKDGTVLNSRGIENAETYEKARSELQTLLVLAWSLLAVSNADIRNAENMQWLSNNSVLINLS